MGDIMNVRAKEEESPFAGDKFEKKN